MIHLKFTFRQLGRSPGFTAAAVLCLGLGIGATTAIFSVVNSILLRPLPYAEPDRLVRVYSEFPNFPNGGLRRFPLSNLEFLDLRRDAASWEALEGWDNGGVTLSAEAEPTRATACFVSGGMLSMLGVHPLLGRWVTPADDAPGAPLTATISFGLWQRAFGRDRTILGREILLNGNKCTVVGVMPSDFRFPPGEVDPPELWVPAQIDPARPGERASHSLSVVGRLQRGVSLARARTELDALLKSYAESTSAQGHGFNTEDHTLVIYGLQDEVVRGVRPAWQMLMGAVGFVLLIACVNVANLLLARTESRQREVAIRGALGASLGQLTRQFIIEGLVLSAAGAFLGLLLAQAGLQ